jgi:uncharacterized membrane protein (DUF2068 family)
VDWNLLGCARKGHVTYAPDEPELRERLMTPTVAGTAWRCLRCGAFVADAEPRSGPASAAPLLRRGKELRSELILRVFAAERVLRFLVLGAAAYGVWRFKYDRAGIQRAFNTDLPAIRTLYRDLGFDVSHSKLIGLIQHSFTLNPRTLTYLAVGLAVYALIELVEGVGLWIGARWGEYFAMVATSVFLPYEIYELSVKVTWLRAAALAVNLLLVSYLIFSKRLLGVRGGKRAYEARLRTESVIEVEQAALVAARPAAKLPALASDDTMATIARNGTSGPRGNASITGHWAPAVALRPSGTRSLERISVAITDAELSVRERAVLLTLLAEARSVSNPRLEQLIGFRLHGARRRHLNELGLVASEKSGRAYAHELTEAGWRWCARELTSATAERPAQEGRGTGIERALRAVIGSIGRSLDATGLSLADVIVQFPVTDPERQPAARRHEYQGAHRGKPRDIVSVPPVRTATAELARQ